MSRAPRCSSTAGSPPGGRGDREDRSVPCRFSRQVIGSPGGGRVGAHHLAGLRPKRSRHGSPFRRRRMCDAVRAEGVEPLARGPHRPARRGGRCDRLDRSVRRRRARRCAVAARDRTDRGRHGLDRRRSRHAARRGRLHDAWGERLEHGRPRGGAHARRAAPHHGVRRRDPHRALGADRRGDAMGAQPRHGRSRGLRRHRPPGPAAAQRLPCPGARV